jgi:hypothetical protein
MNNEQQNVYLDQAEKLIFFLFGRARGRRLGDPKATVPESGL